MRAVKAWLRTHYAELAVVAGMAAGVACRFVEPAWRPVCEAAGKVLFGAIGP